MEHSPVSDPGKECEPEIGSENNIVEKRENRYKFQRLSYMCEAEYLDDG